MTVAFCPRFPGPELSGSFDFPSWALITGSHLLVLFLRAGCFRAPTGLARPSDGAGEAGRGCLSGSAPAGEMSQLARGTVSPGTGYYWKAWPGSHFTLFIYSARSLATMSTWDTETILGGPLLFWGPVFRRAFREDLWPPGEQAIKTLKLFMDPKPVALAPSDEAQRWCPGQTYNNSQHCSVLPGCQQPLLVFHVYYIT